MEAVYSLVVFIAQHRLAKNGQRDEENDKAQEFSRIGKVTADERQRAVTATARNRNNDDCGKGNANQRLADDKPRGKQRTFCIDGRPSGLTKA